ncbi:MAG: 3-dehydroquinate synthase [Candidatus Rokubacteria bacterium]|nr:3-dehydroquinate synthase [Candidatus Rokubacteria bacterium]
MTEITVNLGSRSYPIVVGAGSLATAGERLRAMSVGARVGLVSDPSVMGHYGPRVTASLASAGFAMAEIIVPEGESAKTLAVAERSWETCLSAGLDRTSTLVALGGGTVGDLAGFVAATYMRGIHLVQLPTTLLAQVDAAIGGKNAIDHARAKNLIGTFHQPRLVIVDPLVLLTLPDREFRSGLAEVVKHGIVLDAEYFADVEAHVPEILGRDIQTLERVIAGSCRLKARIVEADETEAALRAVLNYGHTVGHALEAATGYARWAHGEAVALGITVAARIAEQLGLADPETTRRQIRLLEAFGFPVTFSGVEPSLIREAIGRDKKAREGRVPFVLAPRIGTHRLVFDVPEELAVEVIREIQAEAPVGGRRR